MPFCIGTTLAIPRRRSPACLGDPSSSEVRIPEAGFENQSPNPIPGRGFCFSKLGTRNSKLITSLELEPFCRQTPTSQVAVGAPFQGTNRAARRPKGVLFLGLSNPSMPDRSAPLESLPRLGSDREQARYSLRSPFGPHSVRYSAALRSYSSFVETLESRELLGLP